MKKQNKGFTIVELVIVIAVIAVLAAVLIPTFSSLIKKANLSADMQAVREMNAYLQSQEAITKPQSVEEAMQLLSQGNFNSEDWKCLTKGFQIYWYKQANRMVLYNSTEGKEGIVYPDEYAYTWTGKVNGKQGTWNMYTAKQDKNGNPATFEVYNAHVEKALNTDLVDMSSSSTKKADGSGSTAAELASSDKTETEKAALSSASDSVSDSAQLRNSLSFSGTDMFVYSSKELTSAEETGDSYASLTVMSVGDTPTPTLTSATAAEEPNMYYISTSIASDASQDAITRAQKAASTYVYTLFVQMNEKKISSNNVAIVLAPGTTIDASASEWKATRGFSGYFGTTDASNPLHFKNGQLSTLTGYQETMCFPGSGGTYFVTGFFGAVYGTTTIENIVFEDLLINQPGSDFDMSLSDKEHSRNTVGIIGAIVDEDPENRYASQADRVPSNVVVRNIVVKDNVNINGKVSASGLIGYVGGSGNQNAVYNGTLTIENCHVSANVKGGYEWADYGPCGGLIAFTCRTVETAVTKDGTGNTPDYERYNILIKDCVFDGSVNGYTDIGAVIGNIQNANVLFAGANDFSGAKLNKEGWSAAGRYVGSLFGKVFIGTKETISFENVDAEHLKLATKDANGNDIIAFNIGGTASTVDATVGANGYYKSTASACQGNVYANNLANLRYSDTQVFYDTIKFNGENVSANDGVY